MGKKTELIFSSAGIWKNICRQVKMCIRDRCTTAEQADFIRKLLQVIEQNLEEEELGPTLIADRMAMSPRQFYRKFKEISPIAPSDLIKNYRMEKAARLLREEDLSIQDVIADVGISSRSYFYKEFARKFGMTPKDYREQHKNCLLYTSIVHLHLDKV